MEKVINFVVVMALTLVIYSCSQNRREEAQIEESPVMLAPMEAKSSEVTDESMSVKDKQVIQNSMPVDLNDNSTPVDLEEASTAEKVAPVSSAAAVETGDPNRRFIRTADLRFRAKNVEHTTYCIENITVAHGGFVTNSTLQSTINRVEEVAVSKDSALRITYFTVGCSLVLRVPNVNLDTTLKDIAPLVEYLDYRTVKANDVALGLMANNMAHKRLEKYKQRLTGAIDNRGKRLNETMGAEGQLLAAGERSDNTTLSNLSLEDQISFSTITVAIYQYQQSKKEMVEREINVDQYNKYKPSVGSKFGNAFNAGWKFVVECFILVSYAWVAILAAIVIFVGYRLYKWKKKE